MSFPAFQSPMLPLAIAFLSFLPSLSASPQGLSQARERADIFLLQQAPRFEAQASDQDKLPQAKIPDLDLGPAPAYLDAELAPKASLSSFPGTRETLRELEMALAEAKREQGSFGAWESLNRGVRRLLQNAREIPPPMAITLRAALKASQVQNAREGFALMAAVSEGVLRHAEDFTQSKESAFRQSLRLARIASYEKGWFASHQILDSMLRDFVAAKGHFFPNPFAEKLTEMLRRAAHSVASSDASKILDQGLKSVEAKAKNLGHAFEMIVAVEEGSRVSDLSLGTFLTHIFRRLVQERELAPNSIVASLLLATQKAAATVALPGSQRRVYGAIARQLVRAPSQPGEYFRIAQATCENQKQSLFKDQLYHTYGSEALRSDFLEPARRDHLKAILREAQMSFGSKALGILQDGFRALSR